jgi:general secretion pathway protein G
MCRRSRGFTFIEMLVTLSILATLATVALPLSELKVKRDKEVALARALNQIRDAIDAYKAAADAGHVTRSADESGYPPTLTALVDGVPDAQSTGGSKLYFLRRLPRDPFSNDSTGKPDTSWGLRSYESSAQDPRPGRDIFDVYSRSDLRGINGVLYREW